MADYQTTPLSQDLYSRTMIRQFDEHEIIGVPTAFQSLFGVSENGAETIYSPDANEIDIDITRGEERTAALVPRGMVGRSLGSLSEDLSVEKFTNFNRTFPLSVERGSINASQLLNRNAGENPYENRTRMTRLRILAAKIHKEAIRRIIRMNEILAATSILTGKMPAIIGTVDPDLLYDWRRKATHTVNVTNKWDSGSQTIMADIDAGCDLIRADGHVTADYLILGQGAMKAFIADSDVVAKADNRRYHDMVVIDKKGLAPGFQRMIEGGFMLRGQIDTPGGYTLFLFTYPDLYTNSGGTATKYMPDANGILGWSGARFDRYFGPPESLPMIPQRAELYRQLFGISPEAPPMPPKIKGAGHAVNQAMFFHDAYVSPDWTNVTARTQSAPIFSTTMTDTLYVMGNLV